MKGVFENIKATPAFGASVNAALKSGKLSHALILEGSDNLSRLEAAKQIALSMLCKSEGEKPCGECRPCRKILSGSHPDLHILKKEDGATMIKVDAVRELKKKALVFPNDGDKSVFIIDNAEDMNPQAQNALLKIFEEPSKHLLFILCCGSKSSLLDTIISRATCYSLGEQDEKNTGDEKAEKAKALSNELIGCLCDSNELEFLKKLAVFQKDKPLFRLMLKEAVLIVRDAAVLQSGGNSLVSSFGDTAHKLKTKLTQKNTVEIIKVLNSFEELLDRNPNFNLTLTRFSSLLYSIKSH